jgi:hypothetical protein
VERRRCDPGASDVLTVGTESWQDLRVAHFREAALAIVAAADARQTRDYVGTLNHAIFDGLMRSIQTAEREELVSCTYSPLDESQVRRYAFLHSVLLPITVTDQKRAWLPFDTRPAHLVCRICHRRTVVVEIGTDRPCRRQLEHYCTACAKKYCDQTLTCPAWGDRTWSPAPVPHRDGTPSHAIMSLQTLEEIRQRDAMRAVRRNWCAPLRKTDTFVGNIGVYGCVPRSVTSGTWRGLIAFGV